jgi:fumarate reductase subunit C
MHGASAGGLDRWPAWLDVIQGASGLVLVLFMWTHMFMVSSILLGKDANYFVARMFEGEPLFGKPYPLLVSAIAGLIAALFVLHAMVAIRKIPSSWREYQAFRHHAKSFGHAETSLWMLQVVTGFILMFIAAAHLYQMMVHPSDIGPYASADRIWSGRWWPLYVVLLFAVELHAIVGLYRLALKWGWFTDKKGRTDRRKLQLVAASLIVFFLALGLTTLAAEMKVGYEHRHKVGERYSPQHIPAPALPVQHNGQNP